MPPAPPPPPAASLSKPAPAAPSLPPAPPFPVPTQPSLLPPDPVIGGRMEMPPVAEPLPPPLEPIPPIVTAPAAPLPSPGRVRRDPARRWTAAAIAAGLLMILGVGIILWSSAPGLLAQVGLPIGPAESPLRLVDNPIERRDLTNGSELFAVSGKVLNPSATRQRVPDIRADLRDSSGKIVFSWTITPQQRTLAPKSAIDFNSAKLDVPANSKRLELSFVGEGS